MNGIATITPKKRRKTKRAIYDWHKERTFDTPWCKRSELHRRACRAGPARLYDLWSTFASDALAAGVTVFGWRASWARASR